MDSMFLNIRHQEVLLGLVCVSLVANSALADVVLKINIADSHNVEFIGTGALATNAENSGYSYEGVTLTGFFSAEPGSRYSFLQSLTEGLTAGVASEELAGVQNESRANYFGGPWDDLNIYGSGGDLLQFATDKPAFGGSASADFSTASSFLRGIGYQGSVYAGGVGYKGALLGEYEIIPEPSFLPVAAAGIAGFFAFAARRRKAS